MESLDEAFGGDMLEHQQSCSGPSVLPDASHVPSSCERDLLLEISVGSAEAFVTAQLLPLPNLTPSLPPTGLFLKHSAIGLSALFQRLRVCSLETPACTSVAARSLSECLSNEAGLKGEDEVVPGIEPEGLVPTSGSTRPWQG